MQPATFPQLTRRLGILVISFRADVALEDDFAYLFAVSCYVGENALWLLCLDDPRRFADDETMTLSCHTIVFDFLRKYIPFRHMVTFGDWTVGFRKAIDVYRIQVQI